MFLGPLVTLNSTFSQFCIIIEFKPCNSSGTLHKVNDQWHLRGVETSPWVEKILEKMSNTMHMIFGPCFENFIG